MKYDCQEHQKMCWSLIIKIANNALRYKQISALTVTQ